MVVEVLAFFFDATILLFAYLIALRCHRQTAVCLGHSPSSPKRKQSGSHMTFNLLKVLLTVRGFKNRD